MGKIVITPQTTVVKLKDRFKNEFGGSLRVYSGRSEASDEVDIPELVGFFKYNYRDLSEIKRGDIQQLYKEIKDSYSDIEWILFDNIDKIRKIKDREDWEYIVKYALRNEEYEMLLNKPGGELLVFPFDKLRVIARCSKWPDYLDARTLNCLIFDFNQFNNN